MTSQPLISVIVPVYNAAPYLSACLDSLLHQTYPHLQILLINDGSEDDSPRLLAQYQAQDPRIEVLTQPNQGQAAARNAGLQRAKGEWVAFVDADDQVAPNLFEHLLSLPVESYDCIQFAFSRVIEGQHSQPVRSRSFYRFTTPWIRLYRHQFLLDHALAFPEGMIYEDVVFSLDLWGARPRYCIVPFVGYYYTLNPTSTTSQAHPQAEQTLYRLLRAKRKQTPSFKHKLLITYTLLRLRLHFKKG